MDNDIPPADTRGQPLRAALLKERQALLDLSTRNRLLNLPLRTTNLRTLQIVDERAAEVLRLLNDGKAMTFLPGAEVDLDRPFELIGSQPEDKSPAERHVDLKLQTRLASENLQKRLFDIWYDARTLEQEQGVNILYLALGLLRWYDDDKVDTPRHAPLVLLPVMLERSSATEKFRLKGRGEPPSPNLTLQARMRADFGLTIEGFPESDDYGEDEVDLAAYAARIAEAVRPHRRWEVLPDAMVLGFFSFAKFLMYRDLDPENWPQDAEIDDHPLVRALLRDGFAPDAPLIGDDDDIDTVLPPGERMHVVDADSSQTVAIAEAAGGRSLVVKGPPGTGKSQTITNIIAAAVARGKTVLFVAEKMAALDVVHRRLRQAGLGPLALELHSNKISKRTVLEDLKRTKDAPPAPTPADADTLDRLDDSTRALNAFAARLHAPLQPSGLAPQEILGRLARWRQAGEPGRETPLDGAGDWTAQEAAARRDLAQDVAERLAALGPIPEHPWRGVGAEAFDPSETDRLARDIAQVRGNLAAAVGEAGVAVELFGAPQPVNVADLDTALAYLQLTPLPRAADRAAFADAAWRNPKALGDLIRAGEHLTQLRGQARATFNDIGLIADYAAIRTDIATKSGNLFRFLDGGYKRNIALLRTYLRTPLPKAPAERLRIADLALGLKQAEADFARLEDVNGLNGGRAFGALWRGTESDWKALDNVLRWRTSHDRLPAPVWARLAAATDAHLAAGDRARQALHASLNAWRSGMDALATTLDLDLGRAFGPDAPALGALEARYAAWLGHMEQLSRFIAFASRGRRLSAMGAGAVVEAAHDGRLDHATFLPVFDGAYAEVLRDALFSAWPELKAFDGDGHDRLVRRFGEQDMARIALARARIAAGHSEGRPRSAGGIGPLGVLNGELAKKRAHLPLRQLLDLAGPAIQGLKPVFMMSPLSVAQFLKPGGLSFDLLVMDEASQIEPVDALGAIARVKQIVVVGDERQLPPTAFFKTLTGEDMAEEGEGEEAALLRASDTESILDLCLAKGAPYRMLNWHYRSRHQSLIAVSNREFYGSQLSIVPSPYDAASGMGLKFHHLKAAWYDRGGTRTNPEEARLVAEAVIAHARAHPDQSLGVAAFSVSQRQAILRELERLRRQHPDTEPFFAEDGPDSSSFSQKEPFFVKNLENIQGDERDVVFISVGYGFTRDGHLAHNFGPLSAAGGERRLNVLISRAKTRCEVFCNFTGADIDPARSAARGVAALKLFLTFAETGRFDAAAEDTRPETQVIEADVARALRAEGYDVKTRIGVCGFRVDVAVVDPKTPGRFLLGIECDGVQYRDARTACDRDRLRRQVLEAHGWTIHRLWSADWYLRPKAELARLLSAIRAAPDGDEAEIAPVASTAPPRIIADAVAPAVAGEARVAYREAAFAMPPAEARPVAALAGDVARIVAVEGPVHQNEILARVRTLSGQARLTPRVKAAVEAALRVAEADGAIVAEGAFYTVPDRAAVARDRSHVTSAGLKTVQMLPPREIDHAIVTIAGENYGAPSEDLVPAVARRLGFAVTGTVLRDCVMGRIEFLLRRNILARRGDLLVVAEAD